MKHVARIALGIMFFVSFALQVQAEKSSSYVAGTFILKFRAQSDQYQSWVASGRATEIPELTALVGHHQSKGYLSDGTLRLLAKRYHQQMTTFSVDNPISSLQQVAVVQANDCLNLSLLVQKINKLDFVEYAELMPERHVFSTPNDTLFSDIGQYFVRTTRAVDAWDLIPTDASVMIAIVDTGVDYTHEDLKDVVYTNEGETGKDAQGKDKKSNGIDDDNNGFVDDWHGWDFAGAFSGSPQDNDPIPGYSHGTHCAGIAGASVNNKKGIAGTCNRARILPVKIGTNNSELINSYEGIAYAAGMGAPVISCSWGGFNSSRAEQEVVSAATALGSLVVVAAGNNGLDIEFFPAAYKNVLAVASVGGNDSRSTFSNYGSHIGVSAPGSRILSTIPGNFYDYMDGTSMAAPCVAGVAGLVHMKYPSYSPLQKSAIIRATADNIDNKLGNRDQNWMYKLGGRVNAFKALTVTTSRLAEMLTAVVTDVDGDGLFAIGDTLNMDVQIQNLLAPLGNARLKVVPNSNSPWVKIKDSIQVVGAMTQNQIASVAKKFSCVIPPSTPENSVLMFDVTIYDDTTVVGRSSFSTVVVPTYRTLRNNNITLTVNSRGNFGFNDYSSNFQGEGMKYKGSTSFMFESGLMIARNANRVFNVVRGDPSSNQDSGLVRSGSATLTVPGILANTQCTASFKTRTTGSGADLPISIVQNVLQNTGNGKDDFVISTYDLQNTGESAIQQLYCGIYSDWDIDQSGRQNLAVYDSTLGFYYVQAMGRSGLPWVGMQLLSEQPLNIYMMDNDGVTNDNIGVYDNYTAGEKFATMSSGVARTRSNITDVSAVIGAGPFNIPAGGTVQVAFSILAGQNLEDLKNAAKAAKSSFSTGVEAEIGHQSSTKLQVVPNPMNSSGAKIRYTLAEESVVSCELIDLLGNTVQILAKNEFQFAGTHIFALNSMGTGDNGTAIGRGTYFVRLTTQHGMFVEPCIVLP